MTWWEKTVEYAFVAEAVRTGLYAAPLAGREEVAGDAVVGVAGRMILIEFKKDEAAIASEHPKFGGPAKFEEAKKALESQDGHHFLVFGAQGGRGELRLCYRTYFSGKDRTAAEAISGATAEAAFQSYVMELAKRKLRSTGGRGPAWEGTSTLVAGVAADPVGGGARIVSVRTFGEYLERALGRELRGRQLGLGRGLGFSR